MRIQMIASGSTPRERLIRRWGLSFAVGDGMLFDTFGNARVFLENMRRFGIDASGIQQIVLSHDDWDHTSGLWPLLADRCERDVFICPGFKQEIKENIISAGSRCVEVDGVTRIWGPVYSTGELRAETSGRIVYEQSLVIETPHGVIVICGCAHPGVVRIVKEVTERFHAKIRLLVGGFHLKDHSDADALRVIQELREIGNFKIMPTHCTGRRSVAMIRTVFGTDCISIREGDIITV